MEKLKSVIPETLKQKISQSTTDDLCSTCSSLLHFFQNLPLLHQMVRDLTDPEMALCGKNKEAALEAKAKGNECFSKWDYTNALYFYSQALRIAPMDIEDKEKNLVATLYLNRAYSLHKLGFFLESLRDCSRALIVSPSYAKAWFRRAKANSSLGNYEDAINDLNVSLKIETSLTGKRQIRSELNTLLKQSRLISTALEKRKHEISDEQLQMELQCVSTATKGRGMTSFTDIPLASLIHKEDPYAAILSKHCLETRCAFCFNELPADTVPCMSCSIPLYCSLECQVQAGGQDFPENENKYGFLGDLSDDLKEYIRNVTSPGISSSKIHAAEHRHECQGVHWPAVLLSDVVLAGRILVKHIEQQCCDDSRLKIHGILDLCQNYGQLSFESKLEFHVYSMILLCCLQQFYASRLPLDSVITAEIVIILSQIRVNSMAIVRMKYSDGKQPLDYDVTSSVEQLNDSCKPNVHAYFLSRTLFVRATENVAAGSELELSYGPQEYMLNEDKIGRVACQVFKKTDYVSCFKPAHCLSCGYICDLQTSQKTITTTETSFRRLQDAVASGKIPTNLIVDALKSIEILRTVLHPFNKRIAEVEDNVAQAFCLIGELPATMNHCQASIEILEKLYGENHNIIGNELMKLASI